MIHTTTICWPLTEKPTVIAKLQSIKKELDQVSTFPKRALQGAAHPGIFVVAQFFFYIIGKYGYRLRSRSLSTLMVVACAVYFLFYKVNKPFQTQRKKLNDELKLIKEKVQDFAIRCTKTAQYKATTITSLFNNSNSTEILEYRKNKKQSQQVVFSADLRYHLYDKTDPSCNSHPLLDEMDTKHELYTEYEQSYDAVKEFARELFWLKQGSISNKSWLFNILNPAIIATDLFLFGICDHPDLAQDKEDYFSKESIDRKIPYLNLIEKDGLWTAEPHHRNSDLNHK